MEDVSGGTIVRVYNRGGTILIVFSAVLGILAILIATTGNGNSRWFGVALTGGISLTCMYYSLIRRLGYLDLTARLQLHDVCCFCCRMHDDTRRDGIFPFQVLQRKTRESFFLPE